MSNNQKNPFKPGSMMFRAFETPTMDEFFESITPEEELKFYEEYNEIIQIINFIMPVITKVLREIAQNN